MRWLLPAFALALLRGAQVKNSTSHGTRTAQASPCTSLQRACFESALVPSEAARVRELLALFHDGMAASGGAYVLAYGTFLGFARTGSRIPWDDDVDVLIPGYALANARARGKHCTLAPGWRTHARALEARGLRLTPFLGVTEARGRPYFKVHFARGHAGVLSEGLWASSYPFIDVFVDVPYAPGGLCTSCWPSRLIRYDGITVRGPLEANTYPTIRTFYRTGAPEMLRTCVDTCYSHCRSWVRNCGPCEPMACSQAYVPYGASAVLALHAADAAAVGAESALSAVAAGAP